MLFFPQLFLLSCFATKNWFSNSPQPWSEVAVRNVTCRKCELKSNFIFKNYNNRINNFNIFWRGLVAVGLVFFGSCDFKGSESTWTSIAVRAVLVLSFQSSLKMFSIKYWRDRFCRCGTFCVRAVRWMLVLYYDMTRTVGITILYCSLHRALTKICCALFQRSGISYFPSDENDYNRLSLTYTGAVVFKVIICRISSMVVDTMLTEEVC